MKKKIINAEEKFTEVIKLLKSLPKEGAPENFEFELYTKIENKNFVIEAADTGKRKFPTWLLAPIFTAAIGTLVLFLLLNNFNNRPTMPPLTAASGELAVKAKKTIIQPKENFRIVVNKNDVIIKEKVTLPFNPAKSIRLDGYLNSNRKFGESTIKGPKNFVSQRNSYFEFPGFIPVEDNPRIINKLKAEIDSIEHLKSYTAKKGEKNK